MEKLRMYDVGAVYDIMIEASEDQVEELKDEFDMGNSSVYAFERLINKKGYKYKIDQIGGSRRSGFFE